MKPRLLDLFCGAGGAAMGYHRAGFEVVGVDHLPQPNYQFEFHQADAMTYPLDGFDVIHASPPCQLWVNLTKVPWMPRSQLEREYPDFLTPMVARLEAQATLWVVENVPTAPLDATVILCGSSFDLMVRRHRKFRSTVHVMQPPCRHREQGTPIGVYGNGGAKNPGGRGRRYKNKAEACAAMGIDWMIMNELREAIPPAYTEYIGQRLMEYLES